MFNDKQNNPIQSGLFRTNKVHITKQTTKKPYFVNYYKPSVKSVYVISSTRLHIQLHVG